MNRRNAVILAAAALLGLVAVILANAWLSGKEKQQEVQATVAAQTDEGALRIAVAAQDMAFGTPLSSSNVRLAPWPADSVPQGAYRAGEAQSLLTSGNVVIRPIMKGEPILLSRVSDRAVLSANIPQGMRAVTVPVDAVTGVAGFVTPGDVVDVLLTRQIPGEGATGNDKMVNVLLESVPVLAIDLRSGENQTEAAPGRTATLQVSPRDGQKLVLATQVGQLSLALRNIESLDSSGRAVVSTRDLGPSLYVRGRPSAPVAASAPAPVALAAVPASTGPIRPAGPSMAVVRGTTETIEGVQRHGR